MQRKTPKWGSSNATDNEIDHWLEGACPSKAYKNKHRHKTSHPTFEIRASKCRELFLDVTQYPVVNSRTVKHIYGFPPELRDMIYHWALDGLNIDLKYEESKVNAVYGTGQLNKPVDSFPKWFGTDARMRKEVTEKFYRRARSIVDLQPVHRFEHQPQQFPSDLSAAKYMEIKNVFESVRRLHRLPYEVGRGLLFLPTYPRRNILSDMFFLGNALKDLSIRVQLNLATFHAPARASATTCSLFSNIPDGLERLKIKMGVESNVGSLTKDEARFLCDIVRNEMLEIALTKVTGDVLEHRDWDTSSSLSCSGLDPIDTCRELGVEIMTKEYGRRRM